MSGFEGFVVHRSAATSAYGTTSGFFPWAGPTLAPDGRFIVSRRVQPEDEEEKPDQGIHVVENWLADFVSN